MEIEVVDAKSGKSLGTLQDVSIFTEIASFHQIRGGSKFWRSNMLIAPAILVEVVSALSYTIKLSVTSTILDIKYAFRGLKPNLYPERQSFRLEPRGKSLKDEETLSKLGLTKGSKLFFKDLGPQVGYATLFLTEYAGPLVLYLVFYLRPPFMYGLQGAAAPKASVVHIAAFCWTFHYAKRLVETVVVHHFSHATSPIANIFRNSIYYWGFACYVSYYVNHPLYTPPTSDLQVYGALGAFVFCELGNLSIHLALSALRPPGTKIRRIPHPTSNPFTKLFGLVSCPNYTYEIGSWIAFSVMTQSLPALLFTLTGGFVMTQWALNKHRLYKRDFKEYPRGRKAILPFVI